jgi:site-specific recombinase XerC
MSLKATLQLSVLLTNVAGGSERTVAVYHTSLTYLEKYLQYRYQFSIDTALEKLRKGKVDVYNLIKKRLTGI